LKNWQIKQLKELTRGKHGERRKEILRYLSTNPGATPYQIAKELYPGGAGLSHKAAGEQLKKLSELKDDVTKEPILFGIREEKGASYYSLSDEARELCKKAGITLPSALGEELVDEFNGLLNGQLTIEEKEDLRKLMTEEVVGALFEIADRYHEGIKGLAKVESKTDVKRALLGIWIYESEKAALEYKQENLRKMAIAVWGSKFGKKVAKRAPRFFPAIDQRLQEALIALPLVKKRRLELKFNKLAASMEGMIKQNPFLHDVREGVIIAHGTRIGIAAAFPILIQKRTGGEK